MEDGHTIFDYNVGLNDIVQLLVRQARPAAGLKSKDKEAELSDSDSGCGSAQSESDKSSTHGEAEAPAAGTSGQTDAPDLVDPGFGFYKVGGDFSGRVTKRVCPRSRHSSRVIFMSPPHITRVTHAPSCGDSPITVTKSSSFPKRFSSRLCR